MGQRPLETTESELLVCIKCRGVAAHGDEDPRRPGRQLYDQLVEQDLPEGTRLRAVECLQNCDYGNTVALRGPGRWTYVYGNLDAGQHANVLLEGLALYHGTEDGLIPWRQRPEHFKRNCVARVPPVLFTEPRLDPENDS
ncbi:Predicted metal-binding protein [Pseudooceanicola antarcticus]|uniref:DUF1636 domain-containing protein n=1 Tax=Pseudooceanicola antarcticus TaxID=1247613 RepID=A0A285HM86_9RHOB|nr:DUF1636 domain-containing protein [Pseudooceanicola antarcticus]PJE27821.1 DUF1636 domain-containing protein [Pseudooceanicola antarcticus]SNY36723.1 Predicted metal-binding protein [Pseudooceanicola antarcticus]